jgi:hypothetical protein
MEMISKFEARNPNFETISNNLSTKFKKEEVCFENLNLGFVSGFEIRISNFKCQGGVR